MYILKGLYTSLEFYFEFYIQNEDNPISFQEHYGKFC